jgi:hypothetical protein
LAHLFLARILFGACLFSIHLEMWMENLVCIENDINKHTHIHTPMSNCFTVKIWQCCLHYHSPDDGGSMHLWNVGRHTSYLTPWKLEISHKFTYINFQ